MHINRSRARSRRIHIRPRHIIIFLALLLVIGGTTYWLFNYTQAKEAEIEEIETASVERLDTIDQIIVEINERRAEAERLEKEALAQETAEQVIQNPSTASQIDASSCNVSGTRNDPNRIDVMVNKKHCIQPLSFVPGDLVTVSGATISAKASADFQAMMQAAAAAGQPVSVTSSFRSYDTQVSTYAYWVNTSGAAGADTYSARPGYSEHQTGLAVDFASADGSCALDCFGTTSQYQWLQANAARFGFIQRYYAGYEAITGYKAEEWHYRYVGKDIAVDMKSRGVMTLEEYWNMPGGTY